MVDCADRKRLRQLPGLDDPPRLADCPPNGHQEQAVVIRGDETGAYKNIVNVLNICTQAGVTNVAFATAK